MKVVVTGSSGYIGKHVVKELLDRGHTVYICDVNHKNIDERAIICDENIFDGQDNICSRLNNPNLLIHLAWKDGFVHNSHAHLKYLSSHYEFLLNMVKGGCNNIAVMGSMHEIGYWEGAIDEKTPCNPLSQYGVAKNALRQSMLMLSKELQFNLYWLRAFYIFGDDIRASSIFAKLLQAHEDGKKEFPFTSGKNKYDFISVQELASQIVSASTQADITGIINVCSGKPVSLADQVEWFIKHHNLDIKLNYGVFPDRAYDSPGVWGDDTLIQSILSKGQRKP